MRPNFRRPSNVRRAPRCCSKPCSIMIDHWPSGSARCGNADFPINAGNQPPRRSLSLNAPLRAFFLLRKPREEAVVNIKSIRIPGVSALALCAGLFALAYPAKAIDPIKIGVIATPSPGAEWQSQQRREGLQIALKIINDAGGALGRPMELVFAV